MVNQKLPRTPLVLQYTMQPANDKLLVDTPALHGAIPKGRGRPQQVPDTDRTVSIIERGITSLSIHNGVPRFQMHQCMSGFTYRRHTSNDDRLVKVSWCEPLIHPNVHLQGNENALTVSNDNFRTNTSMVQAVRTSSTPSFPLRRGTGRGLGRATSKMPDSTADRTEVPR